MVKIHDYTHHYRGYWSDGGKCRICIYQEDSHPPVVIALVSGTSGTVLYDISIM